MKVNSDQMAKKSRKYVILGCGSVGKCVLHYLPRFLKGTLYKDVYVVDKLSEPRNFPAVANCVQQGAHYIHLELTVETLEKLFKDTLTAGDVVIDLTTRTDCYEFFRLTRKYALHYINTSIEEIYEPESGTCNCPIDGSIWYQHAQLLDIAERTKRFNPPTSIMEFGMNPGLISVFVKEGIIQLAEYVLKNSTVLSIDAQSALRATMKKKDYAGIGKLLKIRTIHCSEIDTQLPRTPNPPGRFANTWSCLGMIDEAYENPEINVGDHEKSIPIPERDMVTVVDNLVVVTSKPSLDLRFYSYVPKSVDKKSGKVHFTEITGAAIHHGEMISLNRYFAAEDFSPTMNYVYCPCNEARKGFTNMSKTDIFKASVTKGGTHVMTVYEDHLEGYDNVGACLLLESDPITGKNEPYGFWIGSILDHEYTTTKLNDPYFGPTTIQVTCGILSAVDYMITHPKRGMLFSEDVPTKFILDRARTYLGYLYAGPVIGCKIRGYSIKDLIRLGTFTS